MVGVLSEKMAEDPLIDGMESKVDSTMRGCCLTRQLRDGDELHSLDWKYDCGSKSRVSDITLKFKKFKIEFVYN